MAKITYEEKFYNSSISKQHFQYLLARHLSHIGMPYNNTFLHQIVSSSLSDEVTRKRVLDELEKMEKIGLIDDRHKVLNSYKKYFHQFYQVSVLVELLKKKKDQKGEVTNVEKSFKKDIYDILDSISPELPVINDYLLILFFLIIKDTDLATATAPREEILNPDRIYNKEKHKENRYLTEAGY